MTAKEKAKELFLKYIEFTKKWDSENGWQVDESDAQQCALIAVNEILKLYYHLTNEYEFWQQVKSEIENL